MARPTILDLKRLGGIYNAEPYMESEGEALKEARCRAKATAKALAAKQSLFFDRADAKLLVREFLLPPDDAYRSFSQALPLHVREWRLPATEQFWRLIDETGVEHCHLWTAIRHAWICAPEELACISAKQLTEAFRSLLNRHGASDADGWLLGKLDCEFDLHNRLYRFHLHGSACGGMIEVLDRMRASSAFKPNRTPAIHGRRVARPLQVERRAMINLPLPLSYILKGHFTARWLGFNPAGEVKRGNRPMRIPEPYGTQALLWLHRERLSDMFVMVHLAIRNGQLVKRT